MKRILASLLFLVLLFGGLQTRAWAAVTPPEKTASGVPGENPNKNAIFSPLLTVELQRDAEVWGPGTVLDVEVGPNLYTYVRQNPWSAFDPEGLNGFHASRKALSQIVKNGGKQVSNATRRVTNWDLRSQWVSAQKLLDTGRSPNAASVERMHQTFGNSFQMKYTFGATLDVFRTAKRLPEHLQKRFHHGSVKLKEGFKGTDGGDIEAAWEQYGIENDLTAKQITTLRETYVAHHEARNGVFHFIDKDAHDVFKHNGGDSMYRSGMFSGLGAGFLAAMTPEISAAKQQGDSLTYSELNAAVAIDTISNFDPTGAVHNVATNMVGYANDFRNAETVGGKAKALTNAFRFGVKQMPMLQANPLFRVEEPSNRPDSLVFPNQ